MQVPWLSWHVRGSRLPPEAGAAMLPTIECEGRRVGGMGGWGVGWSVGCGWSNSKADRRTQTENSTGMNVVVYS